MGTNQYSERRQSKEKCLLQNKKQDFPDEIDSTLITSQGIHPKVVDPVPTYRGPSLSYLDPCPCYHRNSPIVSPNSITFVSGSRAPSPHDHGIFWPNSRRSSYSNSNTYPTPWYSMTSEYMPSDNSTQTPLLDRHTSGDQYQSQATSFPKIFHKSCPVDSSWNHLICGQCPHR